MPRKFKRISTGREFYDDGYDDISSNNDNDDESNIENRLDFKNISFYGRKQELQQLKSIYYNKVCYNNRSSSTTTTTPASSSASDEPPPPPLTPQQKKKRRQQQQQQEEAALPPPFILISGFSGTGKSSLVRQFINEVNNVTNTTNSNSHHNSSSSLRSSVSNHTSSSSIGLGSSSKRCCYSICGKYEELQSPLPFSAILDGLQEFILDLVQGTPEEVDRIRESIQKTLSPEAIQVVLSMVPLLEHLLCSGTSGPATTTTTTAGAPSTTATESSSNSSSTDPAGKNRLPYIFKTLIHAICSPTHPVIMFLDDLQWADTASREFITALLCDTSIQHFMLIGAVGIPKLVDDDPPQSSSLLEAGAGAGADARTWISSLVNDIPNNVRKVQRMELLNLSFEELGDFISDLLDLHTHESLPLTKAIYSKTRGNMLFARETLQELFRKNVLYYSMITFQWEWNLKDIDFETKQISDNVVDVVASKLKVTLPLKLQKALTVAAYTRCTIDVDTLHILMEATGFSKNSSSSSSSSSINSRQELIKILDFAVLEGILKNVFGSKNYQFSHEKIQQAAQTLLPPGPERDQFREKLGLILYELGTSSSSSSGGEGAASSAVSSSLAHWNPPHHPPPTASSRLLASTSLPFSSSSSSVLMNNHSLASSSTTLSNTSNHTTNSNSNDNRIYSTGCGSCSNNRDWALFVAVDHLNAVNLKNNKDPLLMATINLQAGEKALTVAAFTSALTYLQKSLSAIRRITNHWEQHYDISLRLYRALADVQLTLGHFRRGNILAKQVLDHAQKEQDTISTCMSLGLALSRQDRHADALALYWDALYILGEQRLQPKNTNPNSHRSLSTLFSSTVPKILWDFTYATRFLKTHTDEEIIAMPLMKDKCKLAAMRFYSEAAHQAYYCGNVAEWMLITLRRLRISFKYGLCGETALAFTHFASVMGSSLKDQPLALRITRLAKEILVVTNEKRLECQTLFTACVLTDGWSAESYEESVATLQTAHKSGVETGDTEFGFLSESVSLLVSFLYGVSPLKEILSKYEFLLEQLRLYNNSGTISIANQMVLAALYLTTGTATFPNGGGYVSDNNNNNNNNNNSNSNNNDIQNNNYNNNRTHLVDFKDFEILNDFGFSESEYVTTTGSDTNHNINDSTSVPDDTYRLLHGYLSRLSLAVYFGIYTHAAKWIEGMKKVSSHDAAFTTIISRIFYSGLIYSGLARVNIDAEERWKKRREKGAGYGGYGGAGSNTNKGFYNTANSTTSATIKDYINSARKELNEMKKIAKQREIKHNHRCLIMEADLMAVVQLATSGGGGARKRHHNHHHGNNNSKMASSIANVIDAYATAIRVAIENNQCHEAALCHELAGEYCLRVGENQLARKHFIDAIEHFKEWGAMAKVNHLYSKRNYCLASVSDELTYNNSTSIIILPENIWTDDNNNGNSNNNSNGIAVGGNSHSSSRKDSIKSPEKRRSANNLLSCCGSSTNSSIGSRPKFRISTKSLPAHLEDRIKDLDNESDSEDDDATSHMSDASLSGRTVATM